MTWKPILLAMTAGIVVAVAGETVKKENIDESKVPPYTLPDPLIDSHGRRVTTADDWIHKRRPEILRLLETQVYGRAPREAPKLEFHVDSEKRDALGGGGIRQEGGERV